MSATTAPWTTQAPTALLVLADGTVIEGRGLGATGSAVAEVCFNTALTGYQEILTDPSYAGQIVTFTFPHIGNIGTNDEDIEDLNPAARAGAVGAVFRADVTHPSNYRATGPLDQWLKRRGVVALAGIDTRALTALIREKGAPNAVIAHSPDGVFDVEDLKRQAREWSGLVGLDLAKEVTSGQSSVWTETPWEWDEGYGAQEAPTMHVVAIDYGVKRNILRLLAGLGARVTVVPAKTSAEEILAMRPDGIFLSNGPGDPAALGGIVREVRSLVDSGIPIFGICLGHQILGQALGGRTFKLKFGHRGGNQPVKDLESGRVEITSQNHGFAVDAASLPPEVTVNRINLNDRTVEGLRHRNRPVFCVQYHPEASPGPHDSNGLFAEFRELVKQRG